MTALASLRTRSRLVGLSPIAGLVTGLLAFAIIGTTYTCEATIQLHFMREDPSETIRSQQIASMDATAILNGATRSISSRATASAIVTRYALDKESIAEPGALSRLVTNVRQLVGLGTPMRTRIDMISDELLRNIKVVNEARSYLIAIAYSGRTPEKAARLANAFAIEYLRGQGLSEVIEARARAERDLLGLAAVFGSRHPNYARAQAKVDNLQGQIDSLRNGTADPSQMVAAGQSLILADPALARASPNFKVWLIIFTAFGLAAGVFLALLMDNPLIRRLARGLLVRWQ